MRGSPALAGSLSLLGCLSCGGTKPQPPLADAYVWAAPNRQLDIVFSIDNSPASMAPKVDVMNTAFPDLLAALRDPADGSLPDLRIALVDGDLGTGCAYASGSCGPKNSDGTGCFGDEGKFQIRTSPTACPVSAGAEFIEVRQNQAVNFVGPTDNLSSVFACLAANLGSGGCGEQHQLQAFEFALATTALGPNRQRAQFLRGTALLALVFITDKDDCSAAPNDGLFGSKPELLGESASLRCATRGHACGGRNLSDGVPGYPTTASFVHPFADCRARTDTCPDGTDTSVATSCAPLRNVKHMADELKALKRDPVHQILAAGIFGWPLTGDDLATADYKIAAIPNPDRADTQHPTQFSSWPICYNPVHAPRATSIDPTTGVDPGALGWAAEAGLREAAFIDEFGNNGVKLSICQPSLSDALAGIGARLAALMANQCLDLELADDDSAKDGLQPDCQVFLQLPEPDPSDTSQVTWTDGPSALPACEPGAIAGEVTRACWQLVNDPIRCPTTGQWLEILRTRSEIAASPTLPPGSRLHARCRVCDQTSGAGCA